MAKDVVYDIAGIGIGPFNLGLAALCEPIKDLKTIFFEQKAEFNWHEGMMIKGTTLQVSYLSDLVTLTDPCSKYTYLNYLRNQNRLFQFGIHDKHFLLRSEYNRYCKWVCSLLNNLVFNTWVMKAEYIMDKEVFKLECHDMDGNVSIYYARKIVIGLGTIMKIPDVSRKYFGNNLIHSSWYMARKDQILKAQKVAIIGSGQSAAEIFLDLLNGNSDYKQQLCWLTRSDRFYAMEHNKLTYELSTPDYIEYFFKLDAQQKLLVMSKQAMLYKGINYQLINDIYDRLYDNLLEGCVENLQIFTSMELEDINYLNGKYNLKFRHISLGKVFSQEADYVILATGYENKFPPFLHPIRHLLRVDEKNQFIAHRNYSIDNYNRVFIQNAEMSTHGFNAADLSLGPYRNAVIINSILGYEYYPVDKNVTFQRFGLTA